MANLHRIVVACLVLASVAGCGKSAEQEQAEEAAAKVQEGAEIMQQGAEQMAREAQQSSEQMADGLQQMAEGFQQMAKGSAKVVDFEELKAVLPEVAGWTQADTRGEQASMPISISRAETRYRRDDSRIELEVIDTGGSPLMTAPLKIFLGAGYSERSDDGFKREAKVSGYPGMEEWNVNSKRGEVTALVNNRFIVQATGHDVADLADVRKVVEAVNFSRLAALK